jgi:N-acetylmuramoyl-L-alanine amidase
MRSKISNEIKFLHQLIISVLFLLSLTANSATIIDSSIFTLPGSEYSHAVIETDSAVWHSILILKNPNRVVLDLKNCPINNRLSALTTKNFSDDISVKQVRVGNFKAGVTRIVFDLKQEVNPSINVYKPQGRYLHRLTLDFFPLEKVNKIEEVDSNKQLKSHADSNTRGFKNSDSKSSGAKIILEPPDDAEMQTDEYE